MRFVLSDGVTYYRLALPTELVANRFDGPGTWQVLLTIGLAFIAVATFTYIYGPTPQSIHLPDYLKGQIDVTSETSYLRVPKGFLPEFVQPFVEPLKWSNVLTEDGLQLGPIPKGTPIDLIANIEDQTAI